MAPDHIVLQLFQCLERQLDDTNDNIANRGFETVSEMAKFCGAASPSDKVKFADNFARFLQKVSMTDGHASAKKPYARSARRTRRRDEPITKTRLSKKLFFLGSLPSLLSIRSLCRYFETSADLGGNHDGREKCEDTSTNHRHAIGTPTPRS